MRNSLFLKVLFRTLQKPNSEGKLYNLLDFEMDFSDTSHFVKISNPGL